MSKSGHPSLNLTFQSCSEVDPVSMGIYASSASGLPVFDDETEICVERSPGGEGRLMRL